MALKVPGNSHEVKIGLMPIKYIQADHLDSVLSLSGPCSGSLRSFMAPIWTKNGPFWTNMALKVPGNSHEVKIGLIPIKYIQADHLDPVLFCFVICIINLSILAVEFLHSTVVLREGSGGGFLVLRHCNWVP